MAAATETCIKAVVAGLWDLGFVLDHAARSSQECLDLAREEPTVLASLLNRRFLWGGFGLFAALDADLAGLFSGPHAARWRGAVGSALTGTRDGALNMVQTLDNEPDVKQGPGGLRDLQRALSANAIASGRPAALAEPALIGAARRPDGETIDEVRRQPVRHEIVTHVSGTTCYLCLRAGKGEGWRRGRCIPDSRSRMTALRHKQPFHNRSFCDSPRQVTKLRQCSVLRSISCRTALRSRAGAASYNVVEHRRIS